MGRSLRLARQQAYLTVDEAAARAGLTAGEIEALESGTADRLRDRVETLRSLRAYADSVGLLGADYVAALLDLWPPPDRLGARLLDSGPVPLVSVTAAPEGGHSPAGDDRTGATDFSVTGVVSPLVTASVFDTGPLPILETGQIAAVRQAPPRWLKALVVAAAGLVVLGLVVLGVRTHLSPWAREARTDSDHWVHNAQVAVGLASQKSTKPPTHHEAAKGATGLPRVAMVENPLGSAVTVNVHTSTFVVKLASVTRSSWFEVTEPSQPAPLYQQVLPAGQTLAFTVDKSLTVETGSSGARTYMYSGTRFIGFYIPQKAPFTLTFNAVG
jgi:hypothetical protein